jgi:hypothetical protein
MPRSTRLLIVVLCVSLYGTLHANTYGSVEPIANAAVIDTAELTAQPLRVREAFASRLLRCGLVDRVLHALTATGAITTINSLNTHVTVGAGGFMGHTNPSFVFTIGDSGPNAASHADIAVFTDSLGYVLSQASGFLLDADGPDSFEFPANYVVVNFPKPPPIAASAAFFELVGAIDPDLFFSDTSGYTQFGRAYLSLQSDVDDPVFIAGYVEAARQAGLEYTPVVGGTPGLFVGGAAFPGNDWTADRRGEGYLERIPGRSHRALTQLRAYHLRVTREVLRKIDRHDRRSHDDAVSFDCR